MHRSIKKSRRAPRRSKRSKRRASRRLKRSKRRTTRRATRRSKRSKRRTTRRASRRLKRSRRHHVHSKGHASKKKPSPKFSGPTSSRHHSSKKAGKKSQLKSPSTSSRLKPAGRGRTLSRARAKDRATEREMDKLLHGLGGMKLSAAASKKVDRLDDLLHNLQGLDVRSLAEQRSTKLKGRKKRFSFDQEGITHTANILRARGPDGIVLANRLEYFFRQYIRGRGYSPHGRALVSEAKAAIDDIISQADDIISQADEPAATSPLGWQSGDVPDEMWRTPQPERTDLEW